MSGSVSNDPFYASDSVVNNIPCSYIPRFGCVYVLNDTVYNIQYDNGSTEFLYDYGAHVGDKWLHKNLHYRMSNYDSLIPLVVDSVKKTVLNGDTLRTIYTHGDTLNGNNYMGYMLGTLLEGIGSTSRTFRAGPWGWYDLGMPSVKCYSDSLHGSITEYYGPIQQIDSCNCRFSTGVNELEEGQVSIIHSQSQQTIGITFLQSTKANVLLHNVSGQQISSKEIDGVKHTISTHGLAAGVYVCTIQINGYKPYTKKIVVQQ
jgi:hypothetical protein